MAAYYRRLAGRAVLPVGRLSMTVARAPLLLSVVVLVTMGSLGYGEGTTEVDQRAEKSMEPIPVIVNLAVDVAEGGHVDSATMASVRTTVMERLQEALSPDDFAAVRTFANLPAVALSASPQIIALLLAMPEVSSIEADREFTLWDTMSSGFN